MGRKKKEKEEKEISQSPVKPSVVYNLTLFLFFRQLQPWYTNPVCRTTKKMPRQRAAGSIPTIASLVSLFTRDAKEPFDEFHTGASLTTSFFAFHLSLYQHTYVSHSGVQMYTCVNTFEILPTTINALEILY